MLRALLLQLSIKQPFHASSLRGRRLTDAPKMGVCKRRPIFQAVAKHAIETDMGEVNGG